MFGKKKPAELPPPSMKDPREVMEQLAFLKNLTKTTGAIHEAQKLQLDYWVRIIIDNSEDHTIVPLRDEVTAQMTIVYDVKTKGKDRPIEEMRKRLSILDDYVKWLLGDEVRLNVKINGVLVADFGKRS